MARSGERGTIKFRVCDPQMTDTAAAANPAANASESVDDALAAARASLRREFGYAATLTDLKPQARPHLVKLAVRAGNTAAVRERLPFERWFPGLG